MDFFEILLNNIIFNSKVIVIMKVLFCFFVVKSWVGSFWIFLINKKGENGELCVWEEYLVKEV